MIYKVITIRVCGHFIYSSKALVKNQGSLIAIIHIQLRQSLTLYIGYA